MNKIYSLFLLLFLPFISTAQNPESVFIKEYHNYKIDTTITIAVPFKNEFYCLKSNGQVIVIDKTNNKIDASYKDNSKSIKLSDLIVKRDTLFGTGDSGTYFLNKNNQWASLKKRFEQNNYTYEDEKFKVESTCSGEWGGSLYFIDKKTNEKYECTCTCAVNLIKKDDTYFVTASLSHMSGFTEIFQIKNPLKLKKYNRDNLIKRREDFKKKNPDKIYIGTIGDDESQSNVGKTILADSIGVTTAASFIYNSQIYYIVEKYKRVSIDIIKNKKLLPIEDISSLNIWCDYPKSRTYNNQELTVFNNKDNSGFIFIEQNKLSFYIFNRHN